MNSKYFFCYDIKLANFLLQHNFKYITRAIHPNSLKMFWLFEQSDDLAKTIDKFKEEKLKQVQ